MIKYRFFLFLLLFLTLSSKVSAAFDEGHLVGVVYNPAEIEIGIDLGAISNIETKADGSLLASSAFSLPGGTESAWRAAFFARDGNEYYFATTLPTAPVFNPRSFPSFTTADTLVRQYYESGGNDPNHQNAYNYKMNAGQTVPGQYASLNKDWEMGEANLSGLNTAGGYVIMYLYQIHKVDRGVGELIPGNGHDYQAVLQITHNGNVILNPQTENHAPNITSATAEPASAEPGTSVTLSGAATDPDSGDTLTYTWTTTADLSDFPKSGPTASFAVPSSATAGTIYSFTLTVEDSGTPSLSATQPVSVSVIGGSVSNQAPVITSATAEPASAEPGTSVTLSGAATDPDSGDTLTYTWTTTADLSDFPKSGPTASFAVPSSATAGTTYSFTLNVEDNGTPSLSATQPVSVSVIGGSVSNQAPVITSATAEPASAESGASVTLSATATDPDEGDLLVYTWSTSDGITGFPKTGATVAFTAPPVDSQKEITFALTVSDGELSDLESVMVTVSPAPKTKPEADAGGAQEVGPTDVVTLDGSGSSDPNGQIMSYAWSQTDGIAVTLIPDGDDPSKVTFTAPGDITVLTRLTFLLKVTDNDGETDTDSCTIDIVPGGYTQPEADAGPDQTVWENERVTLDGGNSLVNETTTFQWRQLSGPVEITLQSPTSPMIYFDAPEITEATGAFVFELALLESGTRLSFDTVTVTVKKNLPPTATSSALTPTNDTGVWESSLLRPTLAVNNAADAEGDALTYEFELYASDSVAPENLLFGVAEVAEGDTITTWKLPQYPNLEENTHYFFRARAYDGLNTGPWMALSAIFINADEEAPGVPALSSPETGTRVTSTTPTLAVTNTSDPDEDPLTYEFRIFDSQSAPVYAYIWQKTTVVEGTSGTTQCTVDVELEEDRYYWWRVRATDDTHLSGEWMDSAMFLVNTANGKPGEPVVIAPVNGSESQVLEPVFEIEAPVDPEGDAIRFFVELDTVNTFDSVDLIQSGAIPATGTITTWSDTSRLADNTTYFFRVKASDDGEPPAESDWSTGSFFVNQANDKPGIPLNQLPENGEIIYTLAPELKTTAADDADQDVLSYDFEIFLAGNLTDPVASIGGLENPVWTVPGTALGNGKKYFWHARGVDEHGAPGDWSEKTYFTTAANNYQPSIPKRVSPFDGGTVNVLTPTLVVVATEDGDGGSIWVEFELYQDNELTQFVSYGMIPRGINSTSWPVDVSLADQTDYFWRARSTDGEKTSAWTTLAGFTVDLAGTNSSEVKVWAVGNYDPYDPWYTVVEVDNTESAIYGAKVILSPGALSTHETIYVGVANGAPGMDGELLPVGKVVDFGPSGTVFNVPVTIKLPYSNEDLENAGDIAPEELLVYMYNETDGRWETVSVSEVDTQAKLLVCEVNHFSMYVSGTPVDGNSPGGDVNAGGGGSGGCFIGAGTGSGRAIDIGSGAGLLGLAWVALAMLRPLAWIDTHDRKKNK